MRHLRGALQVVLLGALVYAGAASAQATRTWVSGVGDDANPCSRTAPCKTFAGAISKTAAGGEIDVLDPGGFGAVTITKALTIDGGGGVVAGVLVSGTNGIVVQAGATDVVTLRNIVLEGLKTGLDGIKFTSGAGLNVQHVAIRDFTGAGINFAPNQAGVAKLAITNTVVTTSGGGVKIAPLSGPVVAAVTDSSLNGNSTYGLRVEGNSSAIAKNVTAEGNLNGFYVTDTSGAGPTLSLEHCTASHNNGVGVKAGFGGVGLATAYVSDSAIFENGTGVQFDANGQAYTFGNNRVVANTVNGSFYGTAPLN